MGMDLTQEGIGLDLSADIREKRPRVAILGVAWVARGEPSAEDDTRRAKLESNWLIDARRRNSFSKVVTPSQAAETLSTNYAAALACVDADCFSAYGETLEVDRVLVGRLSKAGGGYALAVITFDVGPRKMVVNEASLPSSAREMERKGTAELQDASKRMGQEMAALKLKVVPPEAIVTLGEEDLGSGDIDKNVSAGKRMLRVDAADYEKFEEAYDFLPGATKELSVELNPKPAAPAEQVSDSDLNISERRRSSSGAGGLFSKPGTYIAAAGVAAIVVGAVVGFQAKSIQDRAIDGDGDGILDVTLRDTQRAESRAQLANILFAGGAVAAAGGVTWVLLSPSPAPASSGGGVGVTLSAGGQF